MVAMGSVLDLLERPTYGLAQVDHILGLPSGTARRWIDGYRRGGKTYPPVIREKSTGAESATWGEFIETRLLAEYRGAGVPLIRLRPAIDLLREELNTPYPLASARTWLQVDGRELVRRAQEMVDLDPSLSLVVVRERQQPLWSKPADDFRRSLEWTPGNGAYPHVRLLRPVADIQHVTIDPLRGFGEPVVRGVRTEVIAELVRAGDPPDMIAEMYELPRAWVDQAVRYELLRAA
jgi:uncharacterized protein (DUF433 family)